MVSFNLKGDKGANALMIQCPRCGFEQPPDQYCAQCGVNMETYKIKHRPSLIKEILLDSRLHFFVLILIATTSFFTLLRQNTSHLEERLGVLQGQLQISSSSTSENSSSSYSPQIPEFESQVASDIKSSSTASDPASKDLNEASGDKVLSGATNSKATAPPASTTSSTTPEKGKESLRVIYAEVSRKVLMELFEESQNSAQFLDFDDYQAGIIGTIAQKIEKKEITLLQEQLKPITNNAPLNWFIGVKDDNDLSLQVGLESFMEVQKLASGAWRFNLEIQRHWREASPQGSFEFTKKNFPAMFELSKNSVFFMSGFLPRRTNLQEDIGLAELPAFRILKSPIFIQGQSEFVVFFEITR